MNFKNRTLVTTPVLIFIFLVSFLYMIPQNSANSTPSIVERDKGLNPQSNSLMSKTDDIIDFRISDAQIIDITVADDGELFLAGRFSNYLTGGDPNQAFLAKISRQGIISWTEIFGSMNHVTNIFGGPVITTDNTLITGLHTSDPNLKVFNTSYQDSLNGGRNNYIFEFSENDEEIIQSTYFGGFNDECCIDLAIDGDDSIYVSQITWSFNFPVFNTSNSDLYKGSADSGFAKFNNKGKLIWSTLLGDRDRDYVTTNDYGIDYSLNFGGWSDSSNITTNGAYQTTNNGGFDGFVGKLNSTTGKLLWSTFLGGSGLDRVQDLVSGPNGEIYAIGITTSSDFPLVNAIDTTFDGFSEAFITKFSPTGILEWSTFLGGDGYDEIYKLSVDTDGNLLMSGVTDSSDYIRTDGSNMVGGLDYYITKITPDGSTIPLSTVFGSTQDDFYVVFDMDETNYYLTGGGSASIIYNNQQLTSNYEYARAFDSIDISFVMSLDKTTMELNWYTETPAIPGKDLDYDQDGINNEREYNLCMVNINPICLDPLDTDTDDDGMSDGYEIKYSLNPLSIDSSGDPDEDGLSNLDEFNAGTNPFSNDTDNDIMPDGWEVSVGTDPTVDDTQNDTDVDGMLNIYEYQQGFNAGDPSDATLDNDSDALSNIGEFKAGTDPHNWDTDGDTLPDGWEVSYNLDPLDPDDASMDSDGDGLPNQLEYQLNFNPSNPIELYVAIVFVLMVVSGIFGYKRYRKKRDEKAKEEGWKNYRQKHRAVKSGFVNFEEFDEARELGFINLKAKKIFEDNGYTSLESFRQNLDNVITEVILVTTKDEYHELITSIQVAQSPKDLNRAIELFRPFKEDLQKLQNDLETLDSLLEAIRSMDDGNPEELFVSFQLNDITRAEFKIEDARSKINLVREKLDYELAQRREWLKPWKSLLSLIQITEDGKPISLERISEVTQTELIQAEALVISLLNEYPSIGTYNKERKEYKKGMDVSEYLKKALEFMKQ